MFLHCIRELFSEKIDFNKMYTACDILLSILIFAKTNLYQSKHGPIKGVNQISAKN